MERGTKAALVLTYLLTYLYHDTLQLLSLLFYWYKCNRQCQMRGRALEEQSNDHGQALLMEKHYEYCIN